MIEMSDVSTTLLRGLVRSPSYGADLPHALMEWVTMLIVAREGDQRCKLLPSQSAIVALVYLREPTNLAKIAAGFGISESLMPTPARSSFSSLNEHSAC